MLLVQYYSWNLARTPIKTNIGDEKWPLFVNKTVLDVHINNIALGSRWGRVGVALGSRWGRVGVALGSRWGRVGYFSRVYPCVFDTNMLVSKAQG